MEEHDHETRRPLDGHLVLDLGGWRGALCGRALVDLGADVVVVEAPAGDPARRHPPLLENVTEPSLASAYWQVFAWGKRSLGVNLNTRDGQEVLKRLIPQASFFIESLSLVELAAKGLSLEMIRALNPRLILISITPFGRQAPDHLMDLVDGLAVAAASGFAFATGVPDRPPVMIGGEQAFHHASAYAAATAMLAHRWRTSSGEGVSIDVSAQEALSLGLGPIMPNWQVDGLIGRRTGTHHVGRVAATAIWPCKDGYVAGTMKNSRPDRLLSWVEHNGGGDTTDLRRLIASVEIASVDPQEYAAIEDRYAEVLARYTRAELWEAAVQLKVPLMPVYSLPETLASEVHLDRGFWTSQPLHGAPRPMMMPSRLLPLKTQLYDPAPRIGEHTRNILANHGFTTEEIEALWRAQIV